MNSSGLTGRKSHKGLIIGLLLAAAAAGTGGYFAWQHFKPVEEVPQAQPIIDTVIRTDVENLYSTTGKVMSGTEASVNSKAAGNTENTGYIVDHVYVRVGDQVKKGDLLFTVDTTDIENEIALNEQKLALQEDLNGIATAAASRKAQEAQAASYQTQQDNQRKLQDNADDTNQALGDQVEAQADVAKYQLQVDTNQAAYDSAKGTYDSLKADYDARQKSYEEAQVAEAYAKAKVDYFLSMHADEVVEGVYSGGDSTAALEYQWLQDDYNNKKMATADSANALGTLKTDLANAEQAMTKAKTELDTVQGKLDTAETTLKTSAKSTETAVRALEGQGSSSQTGERDAHEAAAAAMDAVATQNITNQTNTLEIQQNLAKAKQKLDGSSVLADMDGIVTAINVMNGQLYTGKNAIVINNLETMKVTSDIDEAHIADIYVGQEVYIKTGSTGDEKLHGTVSYCSPTPVVTDASAGNTAANANANTQTSKKRASYRVEVELDDPNDRLRIGMTASMDFVIASAKGVLAVPTSSLMSDGVNSFIKVLPASAGQDEDADMAAPDTSMAVETMVTTGVADDYYTEIQSDKIHEGDRIVEESADFGQSDLLDGIYEE